MSELFRAEAKPRDVATPQIPGLQVVAVRPGESVSRAVAGIDGVSVRPQVRHPAACDRDLALQHSPLTTHHSPLTCTLVGKGPSAEHVDEFLAACPESHVCVLNDAGKLIRSRERIEACFFTDLEMIEAARETWPRIAAFRCPDRLNSPEGYVSIADVPGFPLERCRTYPRVDSDGEETTMRERLLTGQLYHHATATAAHSCLALSGYRRVRVIGIDGGQGYAGGLAGVAGFTADLDLWREIQERLAGVLADLFGVVTEWFQ